MKPTAVILVCAASLVVCALYAFGTHAWEFYKAELVQIEGVLSPEKISFCQANPWITGNGIECHKVLQLIGKSVRNVAIWNTAKHMGRHLSEATASTALVAIANNAGWLALMFFALAWLVRVLSVPLGMLRSAVSPTMPPTEAQFADVLQKLYQRDAVPTKKVA